MRLALQPTGSEAICLALQPRGSEAMRFALQPTDSEAMRLALQPTYSEAIRLVLQPTDTEAMRLALQPTDSEAMRLALQLTDSVAMRLALQSEISETLFLALRLVPFLDRVCQTASRAPALPILHGAPFTCGILRVQEAVCRTGRRRRGERISLSWHPGSGQEQCADWYWCGDVYICKRPLRGMGTPSQLFTARMPATGDVINKMFVSCGASSAVGAVAGVFAVAVAGVYAVAGGRARQLPAAARGRQQQHRHAWSSWQSCALRSGMDLRLRGLVTSPPSRRHLTGAEGRWLLGDGIRENLGRGGGGVKTFRAVRCLACDDIQEEGYPPGGVSPEREGFPVMQGLSPRKGFPLPLRWGICVCVCVCEGGGGGERGE